MATHNKSPKKKRDLVIPFAGEENFIVPKRGGFGQPDMEDFVMVTGASALGTRQTTLTQTSPTLSSTNTDTRTTTLPTRLTLDTQIGDGGGGGGTYTAPTTTTTPTTTSTSTTLGAGSGEPTSGGLGTIQTTILEPTLTGGTTTITSPTGGTRDTTIGGTLTLDSPISMPSDWSSVSCTDLASWITQLEALSTDTRLSTNLRSIYSQRLSSARTAYQTQCPTRQAPIVSLPEFPNWITLSCPELDSWIAYLERLTSNESFTTADAATIADQLARAKTLRTSKCSTPTTPVVPVVPVVPAPIGGGGGGIGGGGGGGGATDEDAAQQNIQVEEKKEGGISWLLILAIVGGIWLLSKGKKS